MESVLKVSAAAMFALEAFKDFLQFSRHSLFVTKAMV